MLSVLAVPAFRDNYIWLIRAGESGAAQDQNAVLIVDPGDAEVVMDAFNEMDLHPLAILITHRHADHVGGVEALVERYSLPVYGPSNEPIPALSHPVVGGEVLTFPELEARFEVIDVPGHTTGHIAYYGHGMVFCGDVIFGAGSGYFEGSPARMYASLKKLSKLPRATAVYCAHEYTLENLRFALRVEPDNVDIKARMREAQRCWAHNQPTIPSTMELELKTNPFLRCHLASVHQAAEQFAGRPLANAEEVYAVIRYWKDSLE